jgi:NitT/TauT family transport system ATP-binding protein
LLIEMKVTQPETEPIIIARDVSAIFPNGNGGLQALDRVSFSVFPQEFVCVLGPSGSGKSTLLRLLAGLLNPTEGEILYHSRTLSGPRREVGLVFQRANLMPWRTVLQNITLPLELGKAPAAEAQARARELLELVGLDGFENSLPRDLSGGMEQRVAIARALVHDPEVLLLDEPFGNLDALTRERMGSELLRIWSARRKTVVMVTHSISEAIYLADRVLVLSPRPGSLRLDMLVEFPRPRLEDIRYTTRFGELARRLLGVIGQA